MPRFCANITLMFADQPVLDRLAAAKAAGFPAVEVQDIWGHPLDEWRRASEAAGVEWALFNVPLGDFRDGGPGIAAMPGREAEFRAAIAETRRYAALLRPPCVNVLAGAPPASVGRARLRDACQQSPLRRRDARRDRRPRRGRGA
ncbi:MAG: hypothetical protein FJX67_15580 [Alphaproteobacteria bacterium]|nr:hypothetical protein [Alphaproteobacteria bacterium]